MPLSAFWAPLFDAEGEQWGIINTHGSFVVEPSKRFSNRKSENPYEDWYYGTRRFPTAKRERQQFLTFSG